MGLSHEKNVLAFGRGTSDEIFCYARDNKTDVLRLSKAMFGT